MDNARQPWQSTAGMLHGPVWSAAEIMDNIYHAADVLRPPRSKRRFYEYLHKSKKTFNDYLAAVGMPWLKDHGPPPKDHLVVLMSTDGKVEWVSPTVCAVRGLERDEMIGKPAREVLRQHRVSGADADLFLAIAHELCTGERIDGAMSSYIATADGQDRPVDLRITYGRPLQVFFMDCTLTGEPQRPLESPATERFNVEPGIISPYYAQPRPDINHIDAIHRFLNAPPEEQRDILNRSLPPYRYPGDDDN